MSRKLISVFVFLVLVIGCTKPHGDTLSVAIVGDSITFLTTKSILEELPEYKIQILGVSGARVDEMQETADKFSTSNPGQVVINLGTNDLGQNFPVDQIEAELDHMLSKFGSAKCQHLVTLTDRTMNEENDKKAATINQWMRDKDDVMIVDWAEHLHSHPNLTSDLVHPNETGMKDLASLIGTSVDKC